MVKEIKKEKVAVDISEFEVKDPTVIVPKELPFLVDIKDSWNEAQKKYARHISAYGYANPTKWATKKEKLLENLKRLESEPQFLNQLMPQGGVEVKNTLIQK